MSKEYTAKSFKSGNSVAIRVPAALGIDPECEWIVERQDDDLIFRSKDKPKRKFNIAKVAGSARGLKYIEPESRAFAPRPSDTDGNGSSR